MLYIVLVLVLAALGLLVTALITATSLWAWISIGLSVLAGLLLVLDWLRRRRRAAAAEAEPAEAAESAEDSEDSEAAEPATETAETTEEKDVEQTTLLPKAGELGDPGDTPEPDVSEDASDTEKTSTITAAPAVRDGDPPEEQTSADDLVIVSELEDEVVVVDEHPRYHLTDCGWLAGRDTIPIAVGEARQLGFTPCGRCTPDTSLAAAHR
ncbi:hypothetical protein [Amycolatopsis sp. NPDC059021]|uniref:hypothetical protein n=1 Tax=Amycolatopsis sp. NPDC059021 TaxID=3346704 RepID=UPI0036726F85